MKLSISNLKQIIKEETEQLIEEISNPYAEPNPGNYWQGIDSADFVKAVKDYEQFTGKTSKYSSTLPADPLPIYKQEPVVRTRRQPQPTTTAAPETTEAKPVVQTPDDFRDRFNKRAAKSTWGKFAKYLHDETVPRIQRLYYTNN